MHLLQISLKIVKYPHVSLSCVEATALLPGQFDYILQRAPPGPHLWSEWFVPRFTGKSVKKSGAP